MISQATSQLSPNHIKNLNEFKEFRDYITIFLPRVTDSILQTLIKGDIDTLNLYIAALLQMQHNEKLTQELDVCPFLLFLYYSLFWFYLFL